MFCEFEKKLKEFLDVDVNGEFIHNEFTQLDDEFVFAPLPFYKTEQLKEDNIARCMCIDNFLCLFSCVEKDPRAVQ